MGIIEQLASSQNRRDEVPNQELAAQIVKKQDEQAVEELVQLLNHKTKAIQNDVIKVLYEIGGQNAALIQKHHTVFVELLESKNNRMQWGAMAALHAICEQFPSDVFPHLNAILSAAEKGSVITKDGAMGILVRLCREREYNSTAFPLLIEQLLKSATNQLPMYAESSAPIVTDETKQEFIQALESRMDEIEKESKRKRIEKVIRNLG